MELYQRAGMTIGEALETATDGAARVMGVGDKVGSIAEGQAADLVLVNGDVSKDLAALRQVEWVMMGGKMMDANELRAEVGITGPPAK
jgi:imidazolonepropionase-like amidohydrolase